MDVCIVCVCVCTHACTLYVGMYVRTCSHACMNARVCVYACVCMYVCIFVHARCVSVRVCLQRIIIIISVCASLSLYIYIYLSTFCISILMYCKCVNPKVSLAPGCGALLRTRPAHNALITFYLRPIRGRSGKSVWEHPSPTIRTRRIRTRALAGRTRRIRTHALAGEQARRASPLALGATCPFRGPTAWWSCLS